MFEELLKKRPWHKRLRSKIRRSISNIRHFPKKIKWFIQRGRRGWADCDTWSWDSYISRVNIEGLKFLKENKHTYPNNLTPELWGEKLDIMIRGFESSLERTDILNWVDKETDEKREEIFWHGMYEYTEWFNNLWD